MCVVGFGGFFFCWVCLGVLFCFLCLFVLWKDCIFLSMMPNDNLFKAVGTISCSGVSNPGKPNDLYLCGHKIFSNIFYCRRENPNTDI